MAQEFPNGSFRANPEANNLNTNPLFDQETPGTVATDTSVAILVDAAEVWDSATIIPKDGVSIMVPIEGVVTGPANSYAENKKRIFDALFEICNQHEVEFELNVTGEEEDEQFFVVHKGAMTLDAVSVGGTTYNFTRA